MSIIASNRFIIFTDNKTQDLHRLNPSSGDIKRVTNTNTTLRYVYILALGIGANALLSWLLAIEEDHTKPQLS